MDMFKDWKQFQLKEFISRLTGEKDAQKVQSAWPHTDIPGIRSTIMPFILSGMIVD